MQPARDARWRLARRLDSRRAVALLAICLSIAPGCARLHPAATASAARPSAAISFEGAQGAVSDARARAILGQLEDASNATDLFVRHLAYEQAADASNPLVLGNRLTLLQNGPDTYRAMFDAIRGATDHINLETYIFADDAIGVQFANLLIERRRAGVEVNVIYDSVGSLTTPAEFFDRLRESGIRVLEFNPVNPLEGDEGAWLINNRDHRRQLIIDGRIAFTGGINISGAYASAPFGKDSRWRGGKALKPVAGWRDTHLQIEGPVVAEFQKLFLDSWARQSGEPLPARDYFPAPEIRGKEIVRVIGSHADDPESLIYLTLISAIEHATETVRLTIAYFAPDPTLLEAMTRAAKRGVRVQLVLPSYSDSWPIFNVGRSYYTQLLASGIEIHERQGAVMHAKTATIDGVWSTIGSTNLDWRSFLHNDEINAVILGQSFAEQMEAIFDDDLSQSEKITLERWRQRPILHRLKERLARLGAYWL